MMARRCVLSMVVSVDGYTRGAGGAFIPPAWSADLDRWTGEMIEAFDTLLYGRAAWQDMAAYWPAAEHDPMQSAPMRDLARFMNGARKIVFSRTLSDTTAWANSSLADGDVAQVVAEEKEKTGKDVVIFAGATFAQTALRADVVDAIWLLTIPELFGHGSRLFDGHGLRRSLRLTHCRQMDTGATLTRYDVLRDIE
jgi:dihydrofolate reductase